MFASTQHFSFFYLLFIEIGKISHPNDLNLLENTVHKLHVWIQMTNGHRTNIWIDSRIYGGYFKKIIPNKSGWKHYNCHLLVILKIYWARKRPAVLHLQVILMCVLFPSYPFTIPFGPIFGKKKSYTRKTEFYLRKMQTKNYLLTRCKLPDPCDLSACFLLLSFHFISLFLLAFFVHTVFSLFLSSSSNSPTDFCLGYNFELKNSSFRKIYRANQRSKKKEESTDEYFSVVIILVMYRML